jgi:hypothetical protein
MLYGLQTRSSDMNFHGWDLVNILTRLSSHLQLVAVENERAQTPFHLPLPTRVPS